MSAYVIKMHMLGYYNNTTNSTSWKNMSFFFFYLLGDRLNVISPGLRWEVTGAKDPGFYKLFAIWSLV